MSQSAVCVRKLRGEFQRRARITELTTKAAPRDTAGKLQFKGLTGGSPTESKGLRRKTVEFASGIPSIRTPRAPPFIVIRGVHRCFLSGHVREKWPPHWPPTHHLSEAGTRSLSCGAEFQWPLQTWPLRAMRQMTPEVVERLWTCSFLRTTQLDSRAIPISSLFFIRSHNGVARHYFCILKSDFLIT